ncbi:hypothetical protein [Paenibacillus polymyxa]|uniref:Uncharacterized protein n=1 Tax=Paenibacillus polymyxa (strain SC2) TaxID=886882 RepID=E3EH49_PAEPS|nr:hypothetical protein [Paenibacillus polymyxa]ADO55609.1 hypothetical protein PPSC2_07770 [Paenibacillus polymyxa SC2]WPQ58373.1 hypothetical protein SKN87_07945 [Paenibacillus polymyxa]CCC84413.1 hypothetical protein PPM_1476 [Paenibacillus polymyxa M1]
MKAKLKFLGLAALTVTFAVVISNNVFASDDTSEEMKDVTKEIVPDSVLEGLNHPDKIYTKDALFIKKTQSLHDEDKFNQNEVVYDVSKATDETKAIIQYEATYIKEEDSK